jgi:chromosome partitioning protein
LHARYPALRIVIADADPQQSATKWVQRGQARGVDGVTVRQVAADGGGKALRQELAQLEADLVIIDLPPGVEAVSLRAALYSDLMLVPVGASALELEAARAAIEVCKEAVSMQKRKRFLLVPTRVQASTSAGRELRDVLRGWGPVSKASIGLRVALADAATAGEGVATFSPGTLAHAEFQALAREVAGALSLRVA